VKPIQQLFAHVPVWLIAALLVAVVGGMVVAQQDAPAPAGDAAAPAAVQGADGQAPAEGTDTEKTRQVSEEMTFLQLLTKGGYFMVPIAACSLLGFTLIFERLIALRRGAVIPPSFMAGLAAVFRHPRRDRDAALQYCHANPCPIARVIAVGIRKIPQGIEQVEQGIEDAGANEVARLRRNLRLLYGVSTVAPMIGLLGTVWGMIEAFREVAGSSGLGQASALAHGIYTALVTTFAGLTVAIPILVCYYWFIGRIERIVSDMNEVSEQFIEQNVSGELMRASAEGSDDDVPAGARPAVG